MENPNSTTHKRKKLVDRWLIKNKVTHQMIQANAATIEDALSRLGWSEQDCWYLWVARADITAPDLHYARESVGTVETD